ADARKHESDLRRGAGRLRACQLREGAAVLASGPGRSASLTDRRHPMVLAGVASLIPPSDDKRWRVVDATMRRQGYRPSALIEALHAVQQAFGYLDEPSMRYVAGC